MDLKLANLLLVVGRTAEGDALQDRARQSMRSSDPRMDPRWRADMAALFAQPLLTGDARTG